MNRLKELRKESVAVDVADEGESIMEQVGKRFAVIKSSLKKLQVSNEQLRKLVAADKKIVIPEQSKQNMAKIKKIMDETKKISQSVKNDLAAIKRENEEFAESKEGKADQSAVEMRSNLYNATTRDFYDTMNTYSELCRDSRKDLTDRLYRRLNIVSNGELTQEQMQELAEDPEKAQQVIKQAIVGDSITGLVNEVNQRRDQMRDLGRAVGEVMGMMQELGVLIELQAESLEVISNHVSNARTAVTEGNEHLKQAQKHKASARNWKCCGILLLFVILAGTVGVIYGTGGFGSGTA